MVLEIMNLITGNYAFSATSSTESIFHSKDINQYGIWSCEHEIRIPGACTTSIIES